MACCRALSPYLTFPPERGFILPMHRRFLALALLLLPACRESKPHVREFDGSSAFRYIETQVASVRGSRAPRPPADGGVARFAAAPARRHAHRAVVDPRHRLRRLAAAHQLHRAVQARGAEAASVPGALGQPSERRQPARPPTRPSPSRARTTAARAWRCCSAWPTCSSALRPRSAWTCSSWTARTTATSPRRRTTS